MGPGQPIFAVGWSAYIHQQVLLCDCVGQVFHRPAASTCGPLVTEQGVTSPLQGRFSYSPQKSQAQSSYF
jgi:hypothetical protein